MHGQGTFARSTVVAILTLLSATNAASHQQSEPAPAEFSRLKALANEFWTWRAYAQPLSGDDVTRIERPPGWLPDWWPQSVRDRQTALGSFQDSLAAIDTTGWSVPEQVDYHLMSSALARVDWELNIVADWRRNPLFYIDQTLGSIFDLLLEPPPFGEVRSSDIIARLEHFRTTVESARVNLDRPVRPFAELAIAELDQAGPRLDQIYATLGPRLTGPATARLGYVLDVARSALEDYRTWLAAGLDEMTTQTALGRDAYEFFLAFVAQMPYTPEELVEMAGREWERAVAFESIETQRNAGTPELALLASAELQIEANAMQEQRVRMFLVEKGILSVPVDLPRYANRLLPEYLAPLAHLGVAHDLPPPSRRASDAVKYIREPALDLAYFELATAKDPRPILVHEGIPGHFFQRVVSWSNPDSIRHHYYDSGANEGIGFYAEEMMLQAGFLDDSPRTREIIYNFMRLRAVRVEVDVKLATGGFTIQEAGAHLMRTVPMDQATAFQEAAVLASTPGQAISYQIGKIQILDFLSAAQTRLGPSFDLHAFHDFVWMNGNVPIALQRWEYLGLRDEIDRLDGR